MTTADDAHQPLDGKDNADDTDDAAGEDSGDGANGADTEESADAGETDSAPSASGVSTPRLRIRAFRLPRGRLRGAALPVALAAAVCLAGGLGWKLWQQHLLTQAGVTARHTAVDYAQVLTSIDSDDVDENFAAVLNGATGDFKEMYTKSSVQLRQLLIENKAAAHGVVVDSAIQSQARDRVTVLLMVDQTVTNTARPDPRVDRSRMKITMEKVDGRWLAAKVELP